MGQALEIENRHTLPFQRQEQIGLASAGSAPHHPERPGQRELLLNPVAVGLVPPLQQAGLQIDLLRQPGHAGGAHSPAPAVHPRVALFTELLQVRGMLRQFRARDAQSQVDGLSSALLLVAGSDGGPFLIAEQRDVDRTGPVPLGEFPRAAHVNQWTRLGSKFLDRNGSNEAHA